MQSLIEYVHPPKHIHPPDSGAMVKQRTAPDPRIATNLSRLMKAGELSQAGLAAASGVGQSTISRILHGDDSPTSRTLAKLANALNVTVDEFFRSEVTADGDKGPYAAADNPRFESAGPIRRIRQVPVVGTVKVGDEGYFEEVSQEPAGAGHVEASTTDTGAYALRVRGDSLHPAIRDGWIIVIEPQGQVTAGEYVLVGLKSGRKMIKELLYQRRDSVAVMSVNSDTRLSVPTDELEFVHSIGAVFPPSKWKA